MGVCVHCRGRQARQHYGWKVLGVNLEKNLISQQSSEDGCRRKKTVAYGENIFVLGKSVELFMSSVMKRDSNSIGCTTSSFAFVRFAADDYFYANEVMMTLNIFY